MPELDLRPRIVLRPPGGAVILLIDPDGPLSGTVEMPALGLVPYDLTLSLPASTLTLHVPFYGDVTVPVDPFGGPESGTVTLPGLGPVPYEVAFGPPAIAESELFTSRVGALASSWGPLVLIGLGAVLLMRRR